MRTKLIASLGFLFLLGSAVPAQAQGWAATVIPDVIGQTIGSMVAAEREAQCMRGETPIGDETLAPIRTSAQATMQRYLALAGAAAVSDATPAFSRRRNRREWLLGEVVGDPAEVNDTIARSLIAANAAMPDPERFFRAGDGQTAAGQWLIRDAADPTRMLGAYQGTFRRERRNWVLTRLEVWSGQAKLSPLSPYCHRVGDVVIAPVAAKPPAATEATPAPEPDSVSTTSP